MNGAVRRLAPGGHWGARGRMPQGTWVIFATVVALAFLGLARAGEAPTADSLLTVRRNATVTIGGEMRVDYTYRHATSDTTKKSTRTDLGDFALRNTNLRLAIEAGPNVEAFLKLDLTGDSPGSLDDEILAEALLVMKAVGGSNLELFAGRGRAPYGQDITLGIIQSYNHTANRWHTSEGDLYIIDPPRTRRRGGGGGWRNRDLLPPMRPGQFDRALLAGAAYEDQGRWRAELALFQPSAAEYAPRLRDRGNSGSDIGLAGRLWWRPVEDLTFEASGILARSGDMGRAWLRTDLPLGARARDTAEAVSVGFDWRPAEWRLFGEYQHAWDWNFTEGYTIDIAQLGATRDLGDGWRLGAMGEFMRIDAGGSGDYTDRYYKLILNLRYEFSQGVFVMLEGGGEWYDRREGGARTDRRQGLLAGMRVGFTF